jgi:hypothetical protein
MILGEFSDIVTVYRYPIESAFSILSDRILVRILPPLLTPQFANFSLALLDLLAKFKFHRGISSDRLLLLQIG